MLVTPNLAPHFFDITPSRLTTIALGTKDVRPVKWCMRPQTGSPMMSTYEEAETGPGAG